MEAPVFLWTFNAAEIFCYPRPDLRLNTISEFYGQLLLTYAVNCGTLFRQACAFPNHVQSIEFTTGGLQST
jgi:hypothetical protein